MKFARYLEDTQIPEWKKAYIDYRGLKKRISAIREQINGPKKSPQLPASQVFAFRRRARASTFDGTSVSIISSPLPQRDAQGRMRGQSLSVSIPQNSPTNSPRSPESAQTTQPRKLSFTASMPIISTSNTDPKNPLMPQPRDGVYGYGSFGRTPPLQTATSGDYVDGPSNPGELPDLTLPPPMKSISDLDVNKILSSSKANGKQKADKDKDNDKRGRVTYSPEVIENRVIRPDATPRSPLNARSSVRIEDSPVTPRTPHRPKILKSLSTLHRRPTSSTSLHGPMTMSELLATLSPLEQEFFEAVDRELIKVENFYREREREALIRSAVIKEQLNELRDHRRIFHAYEDRLPGSILPKAINKLTAHFSPPSFKWTGKAKQDPGQDNDQEEGLEGKPGPSFGMAASNALAPSTSRQQSTSRSRSRGGAKPDDPLLRLPQQQLDPEAYQSAKKKLKKAILEFYRSVEYLHNYRILNLTGFRKAVKKYEKTAKVQVQEVFRIEKIEPSILSNPITVDGLIEEIENLYAARFEGGDRKKARLRLRATFRERSHHYSTFRSGLFIGLSVPAIIAGVYQTFQPNIRQEVPAWAALMQIYLALFIPVIFGLLVSFNIIVWSHVRINYIFIFELDVRTAIDSREYAEIPAFLMMTLGYAFYFSFSGLPFKISPTAWPAAWLVLVALVLFNPIPVFYPSSRSWILRKSGVLLLSGTRRVEFQDFFLGDQYCSMVYTLTNMYFMGCLYGSRWTQPWGRCELSIWAFPWLVASLPYIIRFVQCIRRYLDSGLYLHLVNAGKYASSMLYYALYYNWRNKGSPMDGNFVAWVFCACVMSIYSNAWDFLMDWSLFQPNAHYKFLRKDLMYTNHIGVYYFAIITNIIIRFGWLIYVPHPTKGPLPNVRGGLLAVLEALRRFQWNFFRLENEQIGNADQYRVTREVPLPYAFDPELSDHGEDEEDATSNKSKKRSPLMSKIRRSPGKSPED